MERKADKKLTRKKTKLTARKRAFAKYYAGEAMFNGTLAARKAGYSYHSAGRIAIRLLSDPKVRKLIDQRFSKLSMSSDEVMIRLSQMGRGSVAPFLATTRNGEVQIDITNPNAQENLHLIKKIKQKKRIQKGGEDEEPEIIIETELELHDAKDAVVQMGKIHGLFTDKDSNGDPLVPQYKVYVGINPEDV